MNLALGFKLLDPVVSQAETWGFICQCQELNYWQILPRQAKQRWKLQQSEDRWILIVGDVPQLRLHASEALFFLEERRLKSQE